MNISYVVAAYRYNISVLGRSCGYCECTCVCNSKGNIVACLVAEPVCAVLNSLELNYVECLVNSVIPGEGAVFISGHLVVFVCGIPSCSEDVSGSTGYYEGILNNGLGCRLGLCCCFLGLCCCFNGLCCCGLYIIVVICSTVNLSLSCVFGSVGSNNAVVYELSFLVSCRSFALCTCYF